MYAPAATAMITMITMTQSHGKPPSSEGVGAVVVVVTGAVVVGVVGSVVTGVTIVESEKSP
jgi:VIT1/CCC1 family predicted Fe2+/Mn2+ transporter